MGTMFHSSLKSILCRFVAVMQGCIFASKFTDSNSDSDFTLSFAFSRQRIKFLVIKMAIFKIQKIPKRK